MAPENENIYASPCTGTTLAGKPCRSFAVKDGTLCQKHSQSPAERTQAAREGALVTNQSRIRQRALKTAQKLQQAIAVLPSDLPVEIRIANEKEFEETIVAIVEKTLDGSLPPSRAKAIGSLLKLRLDAGSLAISAKLVAYFGHRDHSD